jgi:sarcosine oxidase subunit beta
MTQTADVVIIGGGIAGASIAWHLTQAGCTRVIVVERETHQGKGSTGKSMGGVRAQFATPVNIQMSLHSIPFLANFEQITGYPSGYRGHGYLFLATSEKHLAYLRTNAERQRELGLHGVQILPRDDVVHFFPAMRSDDILGGSFCPTDGFVDPYSVMTGFTNSALERGAQLWRETEATAIERDARGVSAVVTTRGRIETRTVVNAAGPWAAHVASLAGADLPITPLRRMLVPTEPVAGIPERLPMIIDMGTGFHFRPENLGLLLAWNDPGETPGFKLNFDPAFIEKILTHAAARVPGFESLAVNPRRPWAGLYAMSPDHHAILGESPQTPGLFFANGFSGHGVMHSPATGRILADLILEGTTRIIDANLLSPSRFAEGRLIEESVVL